MLVQEVGGRARDTDRAGSPQNISRASRFHHRERVSPIIIHFHIFSCFPLNRCPIFSCLRLNRCPIFSCLLTSSFRTKSLGNVLRAFCAYNDMVEYAQGCNFLAGIMITVLDDQVSIYSFILSESPSHVLTHIRALSTFSSN